MAAINGHCKVTGGNSSRRAIILIFFSLWIFWGFGYQTVWQRFALQVEGTIISCQDKPSAGAPRYASYYMIRSDDGQDRLYIAGATDASLQRSLPVGTHIQKNFGELGYDVNGQWIAFPSMFYAATLGVALGLLLWAAIMLRSMSPMPAKEKK